MTFAVEEFDDAAGLLAEVLMSEPGRTVQSWKQASV